MEPDVSDSDSCVHTTSQPCLQSCCSCMLGENPVSQKLKTFLLKQEMLKQMSRFSYISPYLKTQCSECHTKSQSNDRSSVSKVKAQGQTEWILKSSLKLVRTWLTMTCWGFQGGSMSLGTWLFLQRKPTDALFKFFFNQHGNKVGFFQRGLRKDGSEGWCKPQTLDMSVQLQNSLKSLQTGSHSHEKNWDVLVLGKESDWLLTGEQPLEHNTRQMTRQQNLFSENAETFGTQRDMNVARSGLHLV